MEDFTEIYSTTGKHKDISNFKFYSKEIVSNSNIIHKKTETTIVHDRASNIKNIFPALSSSALKKIEVTANSIYSASDENDDNCKSYNKKSHHKNKITSNMHRNTALTKIMEKRYINSINEHHNYPITNNNKINSLFFYKNSNTKCNNNNLINKNRVRFMSQNRNNSRFPIYPSSQKKTENSALKLENYRNKNNNNLTKINKTNKENMNKNVLSLQSFFNGRQEKKTQNGNENEINFILDSSCYSTFNLNNNFNNDEGIFCESVDRKYNITYNTDTNWHNIKNWKVFNNNSVEKENIISNIAMENNEIYKNNKSNSNNQAKEDSTVLFTSLLSSLSASFSNLACAASCSSFLQFKNNFVQSTSYIDDKHKENQNCKQKNSNVIFDSNISEIKKRYNNDFDNFKKINYLKFNEKKDKNDEKNNNKNTHKLNEVFVSEELFNNVNVENNPNIDIKRLKNDNDLSKNTSNYAIINATNYDNKSTKNFYNDKIHQVLDVSIDGDSIGSINVNNNFCNFAAVNINKEKLNRYDASIFTETFNKSMEGFQNKKLSSSIATPPQMDPMSHHVAAISSQKYVISYSSTLMAPQISMSFLQSITTSKNNYLRFQLTTKASFSSISKRSMSNKTKMKVLSTSAEVDPEPFSKYGMKSNASPSCFSFFSPLSSSLQISSFPSNNSDNFSNKNDSELIESYKDESTCKKLNATIIQVRKNTFNNNKNSKSLCEKNNLIKKNSISRNIKRITRKISNSNEVTLHNDSKNTNAEKKKISENSLHDYTKCLSVNNDKYNDNTLNLNNKNAYNNKTSLFVHKKNNNNKENIKNIKKNYKNYNLKELSKNINSKKQKNINNNIDYIVINNVDNNKCSINNTSKKSKKYYNMNSINCDYHENNTKQIINNYLKNKAGEKIILKDTTDNYTEPIEKKFNNLNENGNIKTHLTTNECNKAFSLKKNVCIFKNDKKVTERTKNSNNLYKNSLFSNSNTVLLLKKHGSCINIYNYLLSYKQKNTCISGNNQKVNDCNGNKKFYTLDNSVTAKKNNKCSNNLSKHMNIALVKKENLDANNQISLNKKKSYKKEQKKLTNLKLDLKMETLKKFIRKETNSDEEKIMIPNFKQTANIQPKKTEKTYKNSEASKIFHFNPIVNPNRYSMTQRAAAASLGNQNLFMAVKLPIHVPLNEWIAVKVIDICNEICLIWSILSPQCNCNQMSAGSIIYWCRKNNHISASRYIEFALTDCIALVRNKNIFVLEEGEDFPLNFIDIVKKILKRIFRVYAHAYREHFFFFEENATVAHLNCCFKHFLYFGKEFKLLPINLHPLNNLVDIFMRSAHMEADSLKP